jgi:uncharacterized protein (UPF0332 family)
MSSWKEIGLECYGAAQTLRAEKKWRSCVSRSYYAVYSVATEMLVKRKVTFRHGMKNPPHDALPTLIRTRLTSISVRDRNRLAGIVTRMIGNRVDADYRPARAVGIATAILSLTDAADALKLMGAY